MKVEKHKETTFGEIEVGEGFIYSGYYFQKVHLKGNGQNYGSKLATGELCGFDAMGLVVAVNLKVMQDD